MTGPRVLPSITEKQWQADVIQLARMSGWLEYHPYDSRRSQPGWPDLALIRPPRLVFAELKTERGRLTNEQEKVLCMLSQCGVETYIWRPSDLERVARILARGFKWCPASES